MGFSSGGKNSVSSYVPSYSSSKNSVPSKNSVSPRSSSFANSEPTRTTKKLSAARGIRDVLELIEELQSLQEQRVKLDNKIKGIEEKLSHKVVEAEKDPSFEIVKQYIFRK